MSEYIDRQAVMKIIDDYGTTHGNVLGSHSGAVDAVGDIIYNLPAADVAPVVHGEWHYNENGRDFGLGAWACSCCGTCNHNIPGNPNMNPYIWSGSKFCPNCGAKMDGEELQNNE